MKFTLDPQIPHSCSASCIPQSTLTFNLWKSKKLCKNIPHPLRADTGHTQPSWGLCYRPASPPAPCPLPSHLEALSSCPAPGGSLNPCSQCSQPSRLASSGLTEQPAPAHRLQALPAASPGCGPGLRPPSTAPSALLHPGPHPTPQQPPLPDED